MARYPIQGTFQDGNGRRIESATISFFLADTSTPANVYAAKTGGAAVHSVLSNSTGGFIVYIDETEYGNEQLFDLTLAKTNYITKYAYDIGITHSLLDEDDMISSSATQAVTQQSIDTFVRNATFVSAKWYGAVGDDSTDDYAALAAGYAYAKSVKRPFYIPAGTYRFSQQLVWDGSINVIGDSPEKTILKKNGNFVGIEINGDQCDYGGFQLTSLGGADVSAGIHIINGNLSGFRLIWVNAQGGDGIVVHQSSASQYSLINCRQNGGSGFVLDQVGGGGIFINANHFSEIDVLGNTDHGFHVKSGENNYNTGTLITAQQNGKNGVLIEANANIFTIYGESNDQDGGGVGAGTYYDINIASGATRNRVDVLFATSNNSIYDAGTNSIILNTGTAAALNAPYFGPRTRGDNSIGTAATYAGGTAGAGATGKGGGAVNITGGDAAGTTGDGNGGNVTLTPGAPVNAGGYGQVRIDPNGNAAGVIVGSTTLSSVGGALEVKSTSKAFILPRLTTTQRNAISGTINGMLIYNSTTNKLESYSNGAWRQFVWV